MPSKTLTNEAAVNITHANILPKPPDVAEVLHDREADEASVAFKWVGTC